MEFWLTLTCLGNIMWIRLLWKSVVTGLIAKLKYFVPTHTLLTIDSSFIAPYLTYGLVAWDQACKSSLAKQKRSLHFINFSNRNEHAIPLFVDANILPQTFSYYKSIAKLMYDVQHRISPKSSLLKTGRLPAQWAASSRGLTVSSTGGKYIIFVLLPTRKKKAEKTHKKKLPNNNLKVSMPTIYSLSNF